MNYEEINIAHVILTNLNDNYEYVNLYNALHQHQYHKLKIIEEFENKCKFLFDSFNNNNKNNKNNNNNNNNNFTNTNEFITVEQQIIIKNMFQQYQQILFNQHIQRLNIVHQLCKIENKLYDIILKINITQKQKTYIDDLLFKNHKKMDELLLENSDNNDSNYQIKMHDKLINTCSMLYDNNIVT